MRVTTLRLVSLLASMGSIALAFADETSNHTKETVSLTWEALGGVTLQGALVTTISNTVQRVFDYNPKWLALLLAIGLSVLIEFERHQHGVAHTDADYVLALINSFGVYAASIGATLVGSKVIPQPAAAGGPRNFWHPWF